jgi:hypothetical protein
VEHSKGRALSPFEKRVYWLTFCGVLVALGTGVFVCLQFVGLAHQNQILSSQSISAAAGAITDELNTRAQLAIAQRQADAAQQGVKVIQQQMLLDQRAWLGIKDITLSHPLAIGHDIDFGVNAFNTGKTPALHVVLVQLSIGMNETRPDVIVTRADQSVVAPNSNEVFYGSSRNPSNNLVEALAAGTAKVYLRGQINYRDIFNRPHKTLFCAYYPTGGTSLNFYNCRGNSMD